MERAVVQWRIFKCGLCERKLDNSKYEYWFTQKHGERGGFLWYSAPQRDK